MSSTPPTRFPVPLKERPYALADLPPGRCYVEDSVPLDGGNVVLHEQSDAFDSYAYQVERVIFSGATAIQSVMIVDTYNYGRALVLDGVIQSTADDEDLYHELLVQPALLAHPHPTDVLIIGGGEGAALREVLAHASVRSATMVDIDAELVDLCREHLVSWHRGAFDDPRAHFLAMDGRKFVEGDDRKYDVVIIDVIDMLEGGPAQSMYTRQFYEMLRQRLRPDALVVVQGLELSFLDDRAHAALARTLRTVFPEVHTYQAPVPSFLGNWGFLLASDWCRPSEWTAEGIDRTIAQRLGADWLDHLTGSFLMSRFALCKETQFLLSLPGPILEDGVAFVQPPFVDDVEVALTEFPVRING